VAISGATSATLTLPEALAADAGSYDVVVTNYLGTVTSSAATLTITPSTPPVITQQPQPATALAGQPASFSVTATGSPPRFQWLRNDVPLSGATQATLSLPAVTLADAGFYTVRLTNRAGTATSAAAALVVNAPPVITVQPAGQTALAGSPVTLSVTVTGHPTPAYQWSLQ
jgi:hypothetical protein